jgi:TPR repeat protein
VTGNDAICSKPVFAWETSSQLEARLAGDPAFLGDRMQQAAARGDVSAQLGWAHMLLEGHGTARDPEAAFRWFQLAARSGSAEAVNMVGRCHELGWGTAQNARMAAQCYRAAADRGHAWASYNLAMLMLAGDGAEGQGGEILALLVRAARRGNAKAMTAIGEACEDAWRGRPKPVAARRWYARAAQRGCFRGAFNTARHAMAAGDVDSAVRWLGRSVAAAPGNFCAGLAAYLDGHPEARLREVAALAREKAGALPLRPASQPPEAEGRPAPRPKAQPSTLMRGRRSLGRMLRALTGARRPRGV